ncbi:MAG: hypothetical protein H7Y59_11260 [Anaerolineales bacterium]|nr:hypothetical protein [Anaerolineales bacterium]
MKKPFPLFLLMSILTINACAPLEAPTTPEPVVSVVTEVPTVVLPTAADQASDLKLYANSTFGLGFQYPSSWYGPDEYVSEQTLRVAIGSDVVYPYGEPPAQPSEVKNSYLVVLQYSKNDQNTYWKETYQSLINLQDGESYSDARNMVIRVRQLNLGRFQGIEYTSTLSETAQTDPIYSRQVILFDEQSNVLTIMGTPNNVEFTSETGWRDIYQTIDAANMPLFHQIVESLTME